MSNARDDTVMDALGKSIDDLGVFDSVIVGADPKAEPKPAEATNVCWIVRGQWREDDRFGPADAIRTVEFLVYLAAVDEDSAQRLRNLARMEAIVVDRFQGTSIGGMTFPALTRFVRGRDEKAAPPVSLLSIRGEFAYLPDADGTGRDEEIRS